MARAMESTGLPYIISFTIRRDGRLIDGTPISEAIAYIDRVTEEKPVCYMTNCVHPRIVREALAQPMNQRELVQERFLGIQANTSPLSYEELEAGGDLQESGPEELAREMLALAKCSQFRIWGGCCGTDQRHMEAITGIITGKRYRI